MPLEKIAGSLFVIALMTLMCSVGALMLTYSYRLTKETMMQGLFGWTDETAQAVEKWSWIVLIVSLAVMAIAAYLL